MIYEVAIAARDFDKSKPHKAVEGDVIVCRREDNLNFGQIGLKERHDFIWFRVDMPAGFRQDCGQKEDGDGNLLRKWGKKIPMGQLVNAINGFRLNSARNKNQEHQPFFDITANGTATPKQAPLTGLTIEDGI